MYLKIKLLKKSYWIVFFAIAVFELLPRIFFGQNGDEDTKIKSDDINLILYGSSDELNNGKTYLPEHPLARGNPFYDDRSKISGTIYIKGNKYQGQVLGYDIAEERVILNVFQKSGAQFEIELDNAIIDSMTIGNTLIVNSALNAIPGFDNGFLEIIFKKKLLFVQRHKKTFVAQYSSISPHGFYTEDQAEYFLIFDSIPIRINSKKSFLNEFPLHKKEIKKYIKSIQFKFKKATKQQWVELLNYCENLLSK